MSPKEEFTSYFRAFLTQNHILYENDKIGTLIYKNNILHVILNSHIYAGMPALGLVKKLPVNSLDIGQAGQPTIVPHYNIIWYYSRPGSSHARFRFLSPSEMEDKDYLPIILEIDPKKNMFRKEDSLGAIPSYNVGAIGPIDIQYSYVDYTNQNPISNFLYGNKKKGT